MLNIVEIMNGYMDIFEKKRKRKKQTIIYNFIFQHANDEKLQQYLQDGLCKLRLQKSSIFDVSALLLQPIQRIVRYPLILNELFKVNFL